MRTEADLRAQARAMQNNSEFDRAAALYTRKMGAYRERVRELGKLLANEQRFRVINYAYKLWADDLWKGGEGTFSYRSIYKICDRGEVSPRVLKTTLALARHLGFLDHRTDPIDRRNRIYSPTQKMLGFPLNWLIPTAEALDVLSPEMDRAMLLQNDTKLFCQFFRDGGEEFVGGLTPTTLQPEFMSFYGHREGGSILTMALLTAQTEGHAMPKRGDIVRRFALSKSQVANLVEIGEQMGMLTLQGAEIVPTRRLRCDHNEWVALTLAFLEPHLTPKWTMETCS